MYVYICLLFIAEGLNFSIIFEHLFFFFYFLDLNSDGCGGTPLIPTLRRQRKVGLYEFQASLILYSEF